MADCHPFMTGPRCFGSPKPNTPWQMVVRVSEADYQQLLPLSDRHDYDKHDKLTWIHTISIGKLRLICCLNDADYNRWRQFTDRLSSMAPVSKAQARFVAEKIFV